jgi:hypothetical protein
MSSLLCASMVCFGTALLLLTKIKVTLSVQLVIVPSFELDTLIKPVLLPIGYTFLLLRNSGCLDFQGKSN